MIGVVAESAEYDVIREFFELFKTPWEFCRPGRRYAILICAGDSQFHGDGELVVFYGSKRTQFDEKHNIPTGAQRTTARVVSHRGDRIPIYGDTVTFGAGGSDFLRDQESQQPVAWLQRSGDRTLVRIGYDLFREVRALLTAGQPVENAGIPTLELHIALLRELILGYGIPLVEIPPVPGGYSFIACMTHDVDHPSVRQHKWDHTTFGFLYRALLGSVRDLIRGGMSTRSLAANWAAAFKLPLTYVGLAKDFWRDFADRYLEREKGFKSTFFLIPFKNRAGTARDGDAPPFRASRYGAQDIADVVQRLTASGCEVGLHGIDAWLDSDRGREELQEIRRLTKDSEIGVRMHWLYYDEQLSPTKLEKAGAAYDSTVGYNGTAGYRAGATQVYRPLGATRLLELPLHVMDTAMFYPDHLGLSRQEARKLLTRMIENAVRFGGCLTVNWHDRSLAPERLWDSCYGDLLQDLKSKGAWFSTAGQAVSWFRKRRSVTFETDDREPATTNVCVPADGRSLPGLRLRTYKLTKGTTVTTCDTAGYLDTSVDEIYGTPVPRGAVR
jgi:hypothetical protein